MNSSQSDESCSKLSYFNVAWKNPWSYFPKQTNFIFLWHCLLVSQISLHIVLVLTIDWSIHQNRGFGRAIRLKTHSWRHAEPHWKSSLWGWTRLVKTYLMRLVIELGLILELSTFKIACVNLMGRGLVNWNNTSNFSFRSTWLGF